jgi:hypothetical protein
MKTPVRTSTVPRTSTVYGEPEGHLGAANAGAEAKALRLSSRQCLDVVRDCGWEPVELFPQMPVLIPIRASIIPRI